MANFGPQNATTDYADYVSDLYDQTLSWRDVEWLKSITKLPVVAKGILTPEDAVMAVESGCEGILVSNHGARQLDGVAATIDALPAIVQAVGNRAEVYMDGGVRRGTDVFKALALGARAVFVGRPVLFGLAHSKPTSLTFALQDPSTFAVGFLHYRRRCEAKTAARELLSVVCAILLDKQHNDKVERVVITALNINRTTTGAGAHRDARTQGCAANDISLSGAREEHGVPQLVVQDAKDVRHPCLALFIRQHHTLSSKNKLSTAEGSATYTVGQAEEKKKKPGVIQYVLWLNGNAPDVPSDGSRSDSSSDNDNDDDDEQEIPALGMAADHTREGAPDSWMLDCGSTTHVCIDQERFYSSKKSKVIFKVWTGEIPQGVIRGSQNGTSRLGPVIFSFLGAASQMLVGPWSGTIRVRKEGLSLLAVHYRGAFSSRRGDDDY
ncbi:hypothetical protein ON010_g15281 [Phytophthora cinnamomi]|nr:hypothetical protein ON010_g15281 [Phytophthora cinnamomi]